MPRLRTLGALELRDDSDRLLGGRPRILALLAWLGRRTGRSAPREEAAALLWEVGDSSKARHSLRQALSELRTLLPPDTLELTPTHVAIAPGSLTLDIVELEQALASGDPARAIGLYRGPFLGGLEDLGGEEWRTWLDAERAALGRELDTAFQRVVTHAMDAGTWRDALDAADRWSESNPTAELPVIAAIQALLSGGEAVTAAARYQRFVSWSESAGFEPSAELLRLGRRLNAPARAGRLRHALLTPDLIGRHREFERLAALGALVEQGGSATVAIEGDEGSGRSRLIAEFLRGLSAAATSPLVVEATPSDLDQGPAHRTIGTIGDLLASAPGLPAAARPDLESLARISSRVAERFPPPPDASLPRVGDALPRVLGEVAAEQPVILVVDDADQVDDASQATLGALARRLPRGVLLLLAAPVSRWAGTPLREALLAAGDQVEWIRLGPLTVSQTATLIHSMAPFDRATADGLARAAVEDLGGLPGQTRALVELLAEEQRIAPDGTGTWRLGGELARPVTLPEGIRNATWASLQHLSPGARGLLEAAAMAPSPTPTETLELGSGLNPEGFRDALSELLAARRLRTTDGLGTAVVFSSEAARRVVAAGVSPARRKAIAAALSPSVEGGSRRQRRRAWLGAAVAVLAVVLGAAAFLRRPLADSGATIVLADVRNETGDDAFDRTLTLAASIELVESERFNVLPRSRVRDILVRMSAPGADSVFHESLAREVAERAGVPLVLAMSLESAEQGYRLVARLVHPVSGDPVRTLVEPVLDRDGVMRGMSRLVGRVRRALGESRAAVAATPPLHEVTTASLEALREYAQGQAAWTRRDYESARDAWRRALTHDSTFAMVHAGLAGLHYLSNRYEEGDAALRRARELEEHLSPRERLVVRAQVADRFGPSGDGIRFRRELATRYPERDSWYNLGTALMRAQRCDEGLPALRRAIEYDPLFTNGHINIATCFLADRDFESALVAYRHAETTDSIVLLVGNIGEEFGRTLALTGDRAGAAAHFRKMTSRGHPANRARGYRHLAWLAMAAGEFRRAIEAVDQAIQLYDAPAWELSKYRDGVLRAHALIEFGRQDEARRETRSLWQTRPDSLMNVAFLRDAAILAWLSGATGHLGEIESGIGAPWRRNQEPAHAPSSTAIRAIRALAEGRVDSAIALTARALPGVDEERWEAFMAVRAAALEAAGQSEAALLLWARIAAAPALNAEAQALWQRADLHVARLALGLGRSTEAWEALERLETRWANGDPDLPGRREAEALRTALLREGR